MLALREIRDLTLFIFSIKRHDIHFGNGLIYRHNYMLHILQRFILIFWLLRWLLLNLFKLLLYKLSKFIFHWLGWAMLFKIIYIPLIHYPFWFWFIIINRKVAFNIRSPNLLIESIHSKYTLRTARFIIDNSRLTWFLWRWWDKNRVCILSIESLVRLLWFKWAGYHSVLCWLWT